MIEPNQLKEFRISLGLSQKKLSLALGLSQSYITKIENGIIEPSFKSMKLISQFLEQQVKQSYGVKVGEVYHQGILYVEEDMGLEEVIKLFDENNISQAPMKSKSGELIGVVTQSSLLKAVQYSKTIIEYIEMTPPIVDVNTSLDVANSLLSVYSFILVSRKGVVDGILTTIDVLRSSKKNFT